MNVILLMIGFLLMLFVMAVAKPAMPSGTQASDLITSLLEIMPGGTIYVGEGSYTKAEADAIFDGMDHIATEIAANLIQISGEIAENPGTLGDQGQNALATRNSVRWGKRRWNPELNVVGISDKQKAYFDSAEFNDTDKTLVVISDDRNDVIIFNDMRWSVKYEGESDGLILCKFMTQFGGRVENKIFCYPGIDDEAGS